MGAVKGLAARLRALLLRRTTERELDEEIRFHIEQETQQNLRLGLSPDEARRQALVEFGGMAQAKEAHGDEYGARWLEETVADARYALRAMRRTPILAGAAILTLALGVGANAAIFSAVNAVILRPLPFARPDELFMLWEKNPEKGWFQQVTAPANVLDWRERVEAFKDVALYSDMGGTVTITGDGDPRLLRHATVSGNFFSLLGVRAALGRTFTDEETWATGTPVTILTHRLWRDRFGSDPDVLGRTIRLDGTPHQIVGVMPEGFTFPFEDVAVWKATQWPATNRAAAWFRRAHWMRAIARLEPGVTPEAANAQLEAVATRLEQEHPQLNAKMGAGMTPLHEFLVGDTRRPLLVLLAAVALLLLIACANVGNLMLVQASSREREAALRLALGAGRPRLVRQALTESLVLSVLGGAGGLVLGWWGMRALQQLQPAGLLRVSEFGFDWSVFVYVLAITTMSGLLFGIAPALWSGRRHPSEALKEGGRSGSDGRRVRRWGERLVVAEVALALVLSLGAGLLVRSLLQLQAVSSGFDPRGVMTAEIDLPAGGYDTGEKVTSFFTRLVERARALPGVESAAAVSTLPLTITGWTSDFSVAGWPAGEYGSEVVHRRVTPDYFRTMRVALLRGRTFAESDGPNATPVIIVNDALARQYFRGQDPIGKRIAFEREPDSTATWNTIIGVVASEHQETLGEPPRIEVYEPFAQDPSSNMTLVLRTSGDPVALAPAIRRVVGDLDAGVALATQQSMEQVRARSLARERFLTTLLILFAATGLALAVVGVYGVMAQLARRRAREMGIRIALGAQGSEVRWLVVRNGLRLVVTGLALGTVGALFATRAMRAMLYGVAPSDPATFIAVPALLVLTAILATWLPAVQASRADPAMTLRAE